MSIRHTALLCVLAIASTAPIRAQSIAAKPTRYAAGSPGRKSESATSIPTWAYPIPAPGTAAPAAREDFIPRHVPGSDVTFYLSQTANRFDVADWRPGEHPPMPEIVAHGRPPAVLACGYCHLPNGVGRPENASLAGLPFDYIVAQVVDMKSGARTSAEPKMAPPASMRKIAAAVADSDLRIAAAYFSRLKPRRWIRVVEADTAPKLVVAGAGMFLPAPGGGVEAVGRRILETPEDPERTELRDAGAGFVAYVPRGSVARGRRLVTTGDGRWKPCAQCHGPDLRGVGVVPRIAGRSPTYLARQLFDIRAGARHAATTAPMIDETAHMSDDDVLAIAAYLASLRP